VANSKPSFLGINPWPAVMSCIQVVLDCVVWLDVVAAVIDGGFVVIVVDRVFNGQTMYELGKPIWLAVGDLKICSLRVRKRCDSYHRVSYVTQTECPLGPSSCI
jgi:hypothetical protein